MRDDDLIAPLRAAWQSQTVELRRFDPEHLRELNRRFERKLRWRNRTELVAAAIVVVAFGAIGWSADEPLIRAGCVLLMLGAAAIAVTLVRRGTPSPAPEALADRFLDWRRETLRQQRDLLASVWWWYLGPLVPGLVLFLIGSARRSDTPVHAAVLGAIFALMFLGIGWMNHAAARRLGHELDELEEVDRA